MCFSANMSFGASAILAVIGTLSVLKVKSKKQIPFALIPFFFAIQQLFEGFLWLGHQGNALFSSSLPIFNYIYLFFALLFWPIWIPLSILVLERNPKRKYLVLLTLCMGIFVSGYLAFSTIKYGTSSKIESHHILYKFNMPNIFYYFYLIATVLPFFLSSIRQMWVLGVSLSISLYIAYYFYINYITSVWCFFSALLSMLVYFIILRTNKLKI